MQRHIKAVVDMNERRNPKPYESVTGNLVPSGVDTLYPISTLEKGSRTAVIPLLAHTPMTNGSVDYVHLPRLVVTVHLNPVRVQQRWLLNVSADAKIKIGSNVGREAECALLPEVTRTCDSVQFHLPRTTLNDFTDANGLPRISVECPGDLRDSAVFAQLTSLIIPCIDAPSLFSSTFMNHFVMLFCSHVVHLWSSRGKDEAIHRGGLSTWQRRRAMELLSKGTYDDVRLAVVAKECRLSVSHFARSFKKTFGLPVHRWVIDQRVDYAKQLLLNSNESLLEIAFQAGFCDQASFNRTFAKLTGTSPGRWRRDAKP
jgi:AraC family transcriptional regulator